MATSLLHQNEPLYQHGLPHMVANHAVPKLDVRVAGRRGCLPDDFSFSGDIFTDGALRGGSPVRARRSGWAALLVSPCGLVIGGLYGPCPDLFPTSLRAELWAFLQMLALAWPPFTLWTDSAGLVDGWHKGKVWCTSSSRPAADLWRQIWRRLALV